MACIKALIVKNVFRRKFFAKTPHSSQMAFNLLTYNWF